MQPPRAPCPAPRRPAAWGSRGSRAASGAAPRGAATPLDRVEVGEFLQVRAGGEDPLAGGGENDARTRASPPPRRARPPARLQRFVDRVRARPIEHEAHDLAVALDAQRTRSWRLPARGTTSASTICAPCPRGSTRSGLTSSSASRPRVSAASQDRRTMQSASASTSRGGRPRAPSSSAAAQRLDHRARHRRPDRRQRQRDVLEDLDVDAAESDRDSGRTPDRRGRPAGIPRPGHHLLHEDARETRIGPVGARGRDDLGIGPAHRGVARTSSRIAPASVLCGMSGERSSGDRSADLRGDAHGLVGIAHHDSRVSGRP